MKEKIRWGIIGLGNIAQKFVDDLKLLADGELIAVASRDLEKAKKLMADAGFADGFEIDIWAMPVQRPYNPNARKMGTLIQQDLKKIGIKANIVTYEWGTYLKKSREGEHQTILLGWTGDNGDPDNFFTPLLSCAASETGNNRSFWCNKRFDDLISLARIEVDKAKRKK